MTERTKGPAVSMRRPPTRGPRDPWTPRTVSLRVFFIRSCRAGPPLTGRRTTCISITLTFTAPRTLRATPRPTLPRTLPKSASGRSGTAHPAGNLAPALAANAANSLYWLADLPAAVSPRETPRPAVPRTLPKSASGLYGGGYSAGHPAPHRAANAANSLYWLADLPAAVTLRATPHPPPPRTLPKSACGLSGTPHPAGNLAPCPVAHVSFFLSFSPLVSCGGAVFFTLREGH